MQYRKVNVLRDETTTINVLIAEWEVPLMEAKHGEDRITTGELVDVKNREWPVDAKSEFNRLVQLYGMARATTPSRSQSVCMAVARSG